MERSSETTPPAAAAAKPEQPNPASKPVRSPKPAQAPKPAQDPKPVQTAESVQAATSEAETKLAPTDPQASPETSTPASPLMTPEPYRITIRLTGADPAAPAEVVTRALREADVRFAVERIERVQP